MVRLREIALHYRGEVTGTRLEEVHPAHCGRGHGIRYTHRAPCPTCGLTVRQWTCRFEVCDGRVIDPDHAHGDPTEWATVVYLDGRTEREPRPGQVSGRSPDAEKPPPP